MSERRGDRAHGESDELQLLSNASETSALADESSGLRLPRVRNYRAIAFAVAVVLTTVLLVVVIMTRKSGGHGREPSDPLERAEMLQRAHPLFDGHNDLAWEFKKYVHDAVSQLDLLQRQPQLQTDIPRMREGELGAQVQ